MRNLHCIVAVLLIPCLIVDPAHLAVISISSSSAAAGGGSVIAKFTAQALSEPSVETGHHPLADMDVKPPVMEAEAMAMDHTPPALAPEPPVVKALPVDFSLYDLHGGMHHRLDGRMVHIRSFSPGQEIIRNLIDAHRARTPYGRRVIPVLRRVYLPLTRIDMTKTMGSGFPVFRDKNPQLELPDITVKHLREAAAQGDFELADLRDEADYRRAANELGLSEINFLYSIPQTNKLVVTSDWLGANLRDFLGSGVSEEQQSRAGTLLALTLQGLHTNGLIAGNTDLRQFVVVGDPHVTDVLRVDLINMYSLRTAGPHNFEIEHDSLAAELRDWPAAHRAYLAVYPNAIVPASGPESSGKNLQTILPRMLLENCAPGAMVGLELAKILVDRARFLPERTAAIIRSLGNLAEAARALDNHFPAWLANIESELPLGIGPLISDAVRHQLRRNSRLPTRRQEAILRNVQAWAIGNKLHAPYIQLTPAVIIDLPLDYGPDVKLVVEAGHHSTAFEDEDHYIDGLNMSLGIRDFDAHFSVVLEDRPRTSAITEHEVWGAGLRALGFPPEQAHDMANAYIAAKTDIKVLLHHKPCPNPRQTSGPEASEPASNDSPGSNTIGIGRRELLARVGIGLLLMTPGANAQSIQNWIVQLGDRDPKIRRQARESLVRESQQLDFSRGRLNESKPVFNAVDSAYTRAVRDSSAPHLAAGLLKVMSHIMWQRARTMVEDLIGGPDYTVFEMYEAAIALARAAPMPHIAQGAFDKLNDLANWGYQYIADPKNPSVSKSFLSMAKSSPQQKDFFLSIHYAALAAVLQTRLKLWQDREVPALIGEILDDSEVDASLGENRSGNFKIGEAASHPISTAVWVFATARELGRHWSYGRSKALETNKKPKDLEQIDDFISDIVGLAALETMGILQAAEIQTFLGPPSAAAGNLINGLLSDPNPPANRWSSLAENLKQKVSGVNALTTFAIFAESVTGTPAVSPEQPLKADDRPPRQRSRTALGLFIGA